MIRLPTLDKDLLNECKVNTYRSKGPGGQHANVTDTAVRLTHLPTGIVVTCQKERSQYLNKKNCIEKLRAKVKQLNYKKPKRIPTKTPSAAKARAISQQKKHAQKKKFRKKPIEDE